MFKFGKRLQDLERQVSSAASRIEMVMVQIGTDRERKRQDGYRIAHLENKLKALEEILQIEWQDAKKVLVERKYVNRAPTESKKSGPE